MFVKSKRVISIFTVICMLCAILPQIAVMAAEEGKTDFGVLSNGCYKLENSTYKLEEDINTEGYISVPAGVTATLDLNGHTIDRGLTQCVDMGSVIRIEEGGTLTVKDSSGNNSGKITGGASFNGGGICNHGTLTFEGGTIEGNRASDVYHGGGGGIFNSKNTGKDATLTITGGVITGNHAKYGGGIYNLSGSTVSITGGSIKDNASIEMGGGIYNSGTINMQGNPYIAENMPNGVYLDNATKIEVTGLIATDAKIDVSAAIENTEITNHYHLWNMMIPYSYIFVTDDADELSVSDNGGEVQYNAKPGIKYIYRGSDKQQVLSQMRRATDAIRYTGGDFENNQFYYVEGDVEVDERVVVPRKSNVYLILCDGSSINFKKGIRLKQDSNFNLFGQTANTGRLSATSDGYNNAAIGADGYGKGIDGGDAESGAFNMYGCHVTAEGKWDAAGIGGGYKSKGGPVNIIYGSVKATGGLNGAGIGGGWLSSGKWVNIYGGIVEAEGGTDAAGIGSGYMDSDRSELNRESMEVSIYGGHVTATGNGGGAGIGGGYKEYIGDIEIHNGIVNATGGSGAAGIGTGSGAEPLNFIKIFGGIVTAQGGSDGAGIGTGKYGKNSCTIEVHNGIVNAYGGKNGAGIGGGYETDGGLFAVSGGTVKAVGGSDGAGVGAGFHAEGKSFYISGGTLSATAGGDASAIGAGGGYGNRAIHAAYFHFNDYKVLAGSSENNIERTYTAVEREGACIWKSYVRLEKCEHSGATYSVIDDNGVSKHKMSCLYCGSEDTHEHVYEVHSDVCDLCGYGRPEYTVSFDANGGSGEIESMTVAYGKTALLPPCTFTEPEGKAFDCWEIDHTDYASGNNTPPITRNTTIYAIWKDVYTVNASVVNETGGTVSGGATVDEDESVTLTAKTADGYRIKEWKDNGETVENNTTEVYTINNIEENHTVTVEFERVAHTVTFDTDGGSEIPPQYVENGGSMTAPQNPIKAGYKFVKWQRDGEDYSFDTPVTENITLKAVWKQLYRLNVATLGNGTVTGGGTYAAGDEVTLTAAPNDGAAFNGWYISGENTQLSSETEYTYTMPEKSVTIVQLT